MIETIIMIANMAMPIIKPSSIIGPKLFVSDLKIFGILPILIQSLAKVFTDRSKF